MVAGSLILGIVGWFAGSSISTGLDKLRSIYEDRQELQDGAAKNLRKLSILVHLVREQLREADRRLTAANASIKPCLVDMRGYVSEAEDLLDELEVKKILINSQVSDKLAMDDKSIKKLKTVLEKLDGSRGDLATILGMPKSHNNEEDLIGLSPGLSSTSKLVHGRDTEIQHLLDLVLTKKSNSVHPPESTKQEETGGRSSMGHPRLILIQGAAGVGKTTLAQVIYNHRFVKEAFEIRGWVFVHECAEGRMCESVIRSFKAEHQSFDSQMSFPSLKTTEPHSSEENLTGILEGKRFLLVLDDIQLNFHNIWAELSSILTKGEQGSIVLVTTHDHVAARMPKIIETNYCISLPHLSESTLWTILKDHTLREQENEPLKSIGQKIAGKLCGLPLLEELIGPLLGQKLNVEHWTKVSDSIWWKYAVDGDNLAFPSVKIVCEYFTIPLKECLCCCSIFPSGYLFEKNKLMCMWMANFARQQGVESMKELFLDELLSMSFLKPTHWENTYVMHDLLRESIDRDELYDATEKGRGKRALDHHRVIYISNFDQHLDLSKLRTMVITDSYSTTNRNEKLTEVLSHSSNLRVLDLSSVRMDRMDPTSCPSGDSHQIRISIETSPPDVIHAFQNLRFLDLSYTKITKIPDSFCELELLQVLGLRGCNFESLPSKMNKLIKLRYLYAEGCTLSLIDKIGQLTNLLELEEFYVSETNQVLELRNLNQLGGQLCITNLEKVSLTDDAYKAELHRKTHLKRLELKWNDPINPTSSDSDDSRTILEALEPPRDLKELKIQGYRGPTFPKWVVMYQDYKCLESIHISHCKNLGRLPPLGLLPSLKFLLLASLPSIKEIDYAFYGVYGTAFQSLEEITFQSMLAWEKWSDIGTRKSMPQLKKVRIDNCPNLKEAPLHCFRETLLELVLSDCGSILASEICLEVFTKLEHLKICKYRYSGPMTLPCPSLKSLVLNASTDGGKIDFSGGTEQLHNLRCLVINGDVQLFPDKTKPVIQEKMSSVSTVEMPLTHPLQHYASSSGVLQFPLCNKFVSGDIALPRGTLADFDTMDCDATGNVQEKEEIDGSWK